MLGHEPAVLLLGIDPEVAVRRQAHVHAPPVLEGPELLETLAPLEGRLREGGQGEEDVPLVGIDPDVPVPLERIPPRGHDPDDGERARG